MEQSGWGITGGEGAPSSSSVLHPGGQRYAALFQFMYCKIGEGREWDGYGGPLRPWL